MTSINSYEVEVRLMTADENQVETCAFHQRVEVSSVHPGSACQSAWHVTQGEVKSQKKKLPQISSVLFRVTRKEPTNVA